MRYSPTDLHPKVKKLWNGLVRDWEFDDGQYALLGVALTALSRIYEAREIIEVDGLMIRTPTDYMRANPALRIEHDATNRFLSAWRRLGLDEEIESVPIGRPPGRKTAQIKYFNREKIG